MIPPSLFQIFLQHFLTQESMKDMGKHHFIIATVLLSLVSGKFSFLIKSSSLKTFYKTNLKDIFEFILANSNNS